MHDTEFHDYGYAATDSVIRFGKRDVRRIENTLKGNYIFNDKLSLNLYCRHYWSTVKYYSYYILNEDGTLYTANLRGAAQVDRYTPAADGEFHFEPRFVAIDREQIQVGIDNVHFRRALDVARGHGAFTTHFKAQAHRLFTVESDPQLLDLQNHHRHVFTDVWDVREFMMHIANANRGARLTVSPTGGVRKRTHPIPDMSIRESATSCLSLSTNSPDSVAFNPFRRILIR